MITYYDGIVMYLEIFRNIQPEDIEDVSERYVPLYSTERESDTVKKINISKYLPFTKDENTLYLYPKGVFPLRGTTPALFVSSRPSNKPGGAKAPPPVFKEDKVMAFFNSAIGVLQTLVVALGAGLGVWGAINLLEGYGNDGIHLIILLF